MRAVPSRTTRAARVPFSGWLALGSAGLALLAPTPYILESPGPAVDLLGEREGRPVLRVEGGEADPGEGTLHMTTVMVGGPPIGTTSLLDLGRGLTDPAVDVVPRELMYPTGVTSDEVGEANSAAMSDSQQTATAAALHELGREVPQRLVVQQLVPGGPAEGVLRAGDEVIAAEGRPVADLEAVRAAVGAAGPDPVTLTVRRDGVEQDLEVPVAAAPEGAPQPWQMGALIETAYDVPVDVELTVPDIGGPSAGLMFALTVIERLTPGAMTGGASIAGTGTITGDGVVGPIGGIPQKVRGAAEAGATTFLAPTANCEELAGRVPEGLTVYPVDTLGQARDIVEAVARGESPAAARTCG